MSNKSTLMNMFSGKICFVREIFMENLLFLPTGKQFGTTFSLYISWFHICNGQMALAFIIMTASHSRFCYTSAIKSPFLDNGLLYNSAV